MTPARSNARLVGFVAVTLVAATVATGYTVRAAQDDRTDTAASVAVRSEMPTGPRIVFIDASFTPSAGRVAVVPLDDPQGPRALTDLRCDRIDVSRRVGVCLSTRRGLPMSNRTVVLDSRLRAGRAYAGTGRPSRTRLSRDDRYVATTTFSTGHSYGDTNYSTLTAIRDLRSGRSTGSLEDFSIYRDGKRLRAQDVNVWGVTFTADPRVFFASAASGGRVDLVRGDITRRELRTVRRDVECPSLSPDGRRLVYKVQVDESEAPIWRLQVLDLTTGRERFLGERRNIDDQVQWLDDQHVLYEVPQDGVLTGDSDVWVAPVDGGRPKLIIPLAKSPAVVR